jgi:Na+/phosphate symporter
MENLISENMKTKAMTKRETRIDKLKQDIKKMNAQLAEQEELLKEEQRRVIERSLMNLNRTLSVDDSQLTFDEIIQFIDFVKNDKALSLEETKAMIDKMKPKNANQTELSHPVHN